MVDKVVRLFTNRKRVICRRCGWTARISWDHDDNYVPTMTRLRAIEPPAKPPNDSASFEQELDVNKPN